MIGARRIIDNYIGNLIARESTGYTEVDIWDSQSCETMDSIEWADYRNKESAPGLSALQNWMTLLANKERRKFFIFNELLSILDSKKVLEIGSGQGHIGVLLRLAGQDIQLTEYSGQSLSNEISDFNIRVVPLDFNLIDEEKLIGFDYVLAVQVDYIFSTEELGEFISKCAKSRVNIVLVTTQVIGPLNLLTQRFVKRRRLQKMKQHGYVRTLGLFRSVGRRYGYAVKINRCRYAEVQSYYFVNFNLEG